MNLSIGGLPGSGKTTVGRILAQKLSQNYLNAGEIFRNLAKKKGMTIEEFSVYAEQNPSVDQAIDNKLVEMARQGNTILEGRLAAFMLDRQSIEFRNPQSGRTNAATIAFTLSFDYSDAATAQRVASELEARLPDKLA